MTHVTCRLTAKNRDQLRNPTLGNRVWATRTFTFTRIVCGAGSMQRSRVRPSVCLSHRLTAAAERPAGRTYRSTAPASSSNGAAARRSAANSGVLDSRVDSKTCEWRNLTNSLNRLNDSDTVWSTPWVKKQDTKLFHITSPNVNPFLKILSLSDSVVISI